MGDTPQSRSFWEKTRAIVPPGVPSEDKERVQRSIAKHREKLEPTVLPNARSRRRLRGRIKVVHEAWQRENPHETIPPWGRVV